MKRIIPKAKHFKLAKQCGIDPHLLAIAEVLPAPEPRLRSTKAKPIATKRPMPDNGVGFLLWSKHNGMDQINGPNGKRVAKVTYDDGSEQVL